MQLISGIITGVHAGEIGSFSGLETARIMQIGEAVSYLWLSMPTITIADRYHSALVGWKCTMRCDHCDQHDIYSEISDYFASVSRHS